MTGIVRPGSAEVTPIERASEAPIRKLVADLEENTGVENKALAKSIAFLTERLDETARSTGLLTDRLDTLAGTVARAVWEKLDATFAQQFEDERAARIEGDKVLRIAFNAALLLARRDAKVEAAANARRIEQVDARVDGLELRIGKALAERDLQHDEVTGSIRVTRERVESIDGQVVAVKVSVEETKTTAVAAKTTADDARRSVDDLSKEVGGIKAWLTENKGKLGVGVGGTGLGIAVASAAPHLGGWIAGLVDFAKALLQ